jgi:hypothetical protein
MGLESAIGKKPGTAGVSPALSAKLIDGSLRASDSKMDAFGLLKNDRVHEVIVARQMSPGIARIKFRPGSAAHLPESDLRTGDPSRRRTLDAEMKDSTFLLDFIRLHLRRVAQNLICGPAR